MAVAVSLNMYDKHNPALGTSNSNTFLIYAKIYHATEMVYSHNYDLSKWVLSFAHVTVKLG